MREEQALAQTELERMQRGRTRTRDRAALVADLAESVDEASDTRRAYVFGIATMRASSPAPDPCEANAAEQAAFERAEMAKHIEAHDHAHLNAMTVVSMFAAVEGCIEALGPDLLQYIEEQLEQATERLAAPIAELRKDPAFSGEPDPDAAIQAVQELLNEKIDRLRQNLPAVRTKFARLPPVARWEDALSPIGLSERPERPLPGDLRGTLDEVGYVRNQVLHRRGRVDSRFRHQAPNAPWRVDGDLIRIGRSEYKLYTAALRTFVWELVHRVGLDEAPVLADWRGNYIVND